MSEAITLTVKMGNVDLTYLLIVGSTECASDLYADSCRSF